MTDERRYQEDEIAEIFERAASQESGRRAGGGAGGLTLSELQSIGREVGVSPARIAEAAATLDRGRSAQQRGTELGMPISVGRTIELPRSLTDHEWGLVVGELRRTFQAQGRETTSGAVRSWTNGNLHAHVEPSENGYRFRIGTLKGNAAVVSRLGIGAMLTAVIMLAYLLLTGDRPQPLTDPLLIGGLGAAALAYNAIRLPRWALKREEQMDAITARVESLLAREPEPGATRS